MLVSMLAFVCFAFPQASSRQPLPGSGTQALQAGPSVPKGYMISGETQVAPPGFTFSGLSVLASGSAELYSERATMPTWREQLGACTLNGKIYAIGGGNGSSLSQTEVYDPATDSWSAESPMSVARQALAVATVGGKIYAIGGTNGTDLRTVEEFDPVTHQWSQKADMPTARRGMAAVAVGESIYVLGGLSGSQQLGVMEVYSPSYNLWFPSQPMPTPRGFLAAVHVDGRIYALGGSTSISWIGRTTVEAYDTGLGDWSTRASMPIPRQYFAAGAVNNAIYVFGGETEFSSFNRYDAAQDRWSGNLSTDANLAEMYGVAGVSTDEVSGEVHLLGGRSHGSLTGTHAVIDPGLSTLYFHRKN